MGIHVQRYSVLGTKRMTPEKICRKCKKAIPRPTWRRYRNGAVHLVWQCECGSWDAGKPLPASMAEAFGMETKDQAIARLSVANDASW